MQNIGNIPFRHIPIQSISLAPVETRWILEDGVDFCRHNQVLVLTAATMSDACLC